jgi:ABC-type phosphonate transport system ATPase subunit
VAEPAPSPELAEPILAAAGLRKEYGPTVAVDSADLTVAPGGSLAIVGE